MNLIKLITVLFAVVLFSASSYASHCGGGHTHDHKKMAENKEVLKKSETEENVEVSIASNSEDEATEDEGSDSDTETR